METDHNKHINSVPGRQPCHELKAIHRAQVALFRTRAAEGKTVVVSRNGRVMAVPAAQLLKEIEALKRD